MTTSELESKWETLKGRLKQRYGQLTDDDLTFIEGKGEELLGRLQGKLGVSREDLDATLDEIAASTVGTFEQAKIRAAEVADQVREKASDLADDLRQRASALGEDARAQGEAAYNEARHRARGLWEDGEEYVRANPRHSILAAVAAGFVAGVILFRR